MFLKVIKVTKEINSAGMTKKSMNEMKCEKSGVFLT